MKKVSIIIPVYNVEPYIERCLLSALNHCGQDNSIQIAKQILSIHPNGVKAQIFYHEKNEGLSVARNTGIKAATGEYLYFLDSDDEITLNCIEILTKESEGYDVVIDHDFNSFADGVAVPHGIYDVVQNTCYLTVGTICL
jgi:glycosyltransferase involved in cell wall biosynthesis